MHGAVAVLVIVVLGAGLLQTVRQARDAHRSAMRRPGGARRDGWLASRRRRREIREKGVQDRLRDEARSRQRIAEHAARAAAGARTAGGEAIRTFIRLKPEKPDGEDSSPRDPGGGTRERPRQPPGTTPPPGDNPPPGGGSPPSGPEPPDPPPPPRPRPSPGEPQPPTREGTPVSSPAVYTGIEDLITAINRLRDRAVAGNAKAKLAALRACSAACTRFASMAMTIARQMAEQGHYGPEITERASAAGIHLTAAASAFSDSANALATLLNLRLGDMPESGRQAPHHSELSETGAR